MTVSDKVASPWSWEFTAGENPAYAHTQEACYMIGGTLGSLSVPCLRPVAASRGAKLVGTDWVRAVCPSRRGTRSGLQVRNLVRRRARHGGPGRVRA